MKIWLLAGAVLIGLLLLTLYTFKRLCENVKQNKPGRHSVFYKWVVSYILFLIISIALCVSIVVNARELLLQEYESASESVRTVTSRLLDSYLENANAWQAQYEKNEMLNQFLERTPPYTGSDRYLLLKLQEQLENYELYSLYADGASQSYIYFHELNASLSGITIRNNQQLMECVHQDLAVTVDELMAEITRYHYHDFVVLPKTDGNVSVLLMSSVPRSSRYTPKATVVQKLDDRFFTELLTDSTKQMGMYMYLVDSLDNIISASNPDAPIDEVLASEQLPASGQQTTMMLRDGSYLVSAQDSDISGWKYITLISPEAISDKVEILNRSAVLLTFFCLCAGVVMAYVLARQQYKPVVRVMRQLSDRLESNQDANEFDLILSAFNNVEESLQSIDHLYHQQTIALQKEFLAAAMHSSYPGDAVRMARALELPTQNCGYFVVLISTYGAADNVDSMLDRAMERCIEMVEKHQGSAYGLELADTRAIVAVVGEQEAKADCSGLFADILAIIANAEWEAVLLAAPSPVVQSINALNLCYMDACFALEEKRKLKLGNNPLPQTLKISRAENSTDSMDYVAKTIVAAAHSGNSQEAEERLLQLLQDIPEHVEPINYIRLAQLLSDLFSTLPATSSGDAELVRRCERLAFRMRNAISGKEIVQILQEAIHVVCSEQARERESTLMDRLISCIESHYTESDFNVSKLAELMDMNMSYLSQHFREQSGIGLLEYINRLRVNRAKEIIQEHKGEFTFQQVAESVGFENLNSFIRVFKKYENVTPGEFRKSKNIEILG